MPEFFNMAPAKEQRRNLRTETKIALKAKRALRNNAKKRPEKEVRKMNAPRSAPRHMRLILRRRRATGLNQEGRTQNGNR